MGRRRVDHRPRAIRRALPPVLHIGTRSSELDPRPPRIEAIRHPGPAAADTNAATASTAVSTVSTPAPSTSTDIAPHRA